MILEDTEIRWEKANFEFVDEPYEAYIKLESGWSVVAGAGLIPKTQLQSSGYDPDHVSGYAVGFGMERIAAHKFAVTDIRDFWRTPYISTGT